MTKVNQKENETRKDYLVRVATIMLDENIDQINTIEFDGFEGDAFCVSEALKQEFGGVKKKWFRKIIMIPITLAPIPVLIHLSSPDFMATTGSTWEGAISVGLLSLLCSPLVAIMLKSIRSL